MEPEQEDAPVRELSALEKGRFRQLYVICRAKYGIWPDAAVDGAGIKENRKPVPENLEALSRSKLQKVAKRFGINAGQTSVAIISELEKLRGTVAQPAVQPAVRPAVQSLVERFDIEPFLIFQPNEKTL